MRKILLYGVVVFVTITPISVLAQWERWQPWVTEIGITPYGEFNFRGAKSCSLGYYELQKTGFDGILGVQVVLPPLYFRFGYSNIYNLFVSREDSIFCPLFADWRVGAQITYEEVTTYDLSLAFLKSFADEDFMALLLEIGYGRIIADVGLGGIQLFGNMRIGTINTSVPDTGDTIDWVAKDNEGIFDISLGVFWRTQILSPYLYTGISYPFTKETFEIRTSIGVGLQLYFPNSYIKPIPDIPYPKLFRGPPKK